MEGRAGIYEAGEARHLQGTRGKPDKSTRAIAIQRAAITKEVDGVNPDKLLSYSMGTASV